jgi:hypothetical protein
MNDHLRTALRKSADPIDFIDYESDNAIVRARNRSRGPRGKPPVGFWYSVDLGWEKWCCESQPDWLHPHTAVLKVDTARFSVLRTKEDVREFYKKYATAFEGMHVYSIDWLKVMDDFDGVEMPDFDYGWGLSFDRPGLHWVYGWDCSSGVCWRPRRNIVVESFTRTVFSCKESVAC